MKKVLLIMVLTLLMSIGLMSVSANAETSGTCGDNLRWTLYDSGDLIISGTGAMYNWENDGAPWQVDRDNIKTVVIASGVTNIGSYAFSQCVNLKSVTFQSTSSVTEIGGSAFNCCYKLSSITIPEGMKVIGDCAFASCLALPEITIPGSIESISEAAFQDCASLKTVTISEGAESIPGNVFRGCPALETVKLPPTVKTISENPFAYCTSLTSIVFPNGSNHFSSAGGVLFNNDKTALLACSDTKETYTVPDTVTSISDYAFYGCESLTSITIPANVTSIGSFAFYKCTALQEASLSSNLSAIPSSLFEGCSALTTVTIPASVTSIGDGAFTSCSSIESITIPDNVTSIADYMFYDCSSLNSITIPANVIGIGSYAFSGCSSLESITIPAKVTSMGAYVFSDSSSLETITFLGGAPTFNEEAFMNLTATVSFPASDESWTDEALLNYGGTITWTATDPIDLSTCSISSISDETYTGEAFEPVPTVVLNGKTLILDKDFSLSYKDNVNAGTATVIVTGIGRYSKSAEATFKIDPVTIAVPVGRTWIYNGTTQTGVAGSKDYTATGNSAKNAGTYTATLTLKDKVNTTWNDGSIDDKKVKWTINKAANPFSITGKTATVKSNKLKKKAQKLDVTKVINFTQDAKDKKAYALSSVKKGKKSFKKYVKIDKTTGQVTIKKNKKMKKGTYKVVIIVRGEGNTNYLPSSVKTVTAKIKVK